MTPRCRERGRSCHGTVVLAPSARRSTCRQRAGYTDAIAGCRQILLDHRGHGRSDGPTTVEGHLMEEYVAWVQRPECATSAEP